MRNKHQSVEIEEDPLFNYMKSTLLDSGAIAKLKSEYMQSNTASAERLLKDEEVIAKNNFEELEQELRKLKEKIVSLEADKLFNQLQEWYIGQDKYILILKKSNTAGYIYSVENPELYFLRSKSTIFEPLITKFITDFNVQIVEGLLYLSKKQMAYIIIQYIYSIYLKDRHKKTIKITINEYKQALSYYMRENGLDDLRQIYGILRIIFGRGNTKTSLGEDKVEPSTQKK